MSFTDSEKEEIISDFPNIKLSYENIAHKKVYNYDFVLAIPEGDKCFAWFTTYQNKNVCFIMNIGVNKDISNIEIAHCCFHSELCYGTIFYGTAFRYKSNRFFTIEDVFYYKGNHISNKIWKEKLEIIKIIMNNDIKQIAYNKLFLVFGLPILKSTLNEINQEILHLPYKIKCIQFRSFHKKNVSEYVLLKEIKEIKEIKEYNGAKYNNIKGIQSKNNEIKEVKQFNNNLFCKENNVKPITKREIVFTIRPDIQNDIYHLYALTSDGTEKYYDIAYIPDFVTSVMMNKLFRNIKENNNLDALEESDEEEEFENDRDDKFVFLDKTYNMVCAYNYKFKKWYPIRLADKNTNIVREKELLAIK